jgi:hypothetical protein
MGPNESLWFPMAPNDPHMAAYISLFSKLHSMGHYDPLWLPMAPYGSIYLPLSKWTQQQKHENQSVVQLSFFS